jgi:hypothetical protein
MPALVEKLGTSSGGAKRDAVELISACAPVYGIAAVSPHIENIWELLKDDVEKAQEDSPEQRNALFCVKSILSTLSSSPAQTNANPLERMLKMIVGDCLSHMKEPESKLARTGGRLIVALASSSGLSTLFVVTIKMIFADLLFFRFCVFVCDANGPSCDPQTSLYGTGTEAEKDLSGNPGRPRWSRNTALQRTGRARKSIGAVQGGNYHFVGKEFERGR